MKTTQEGGGFVLTCACGWLRFADSQATLADIESKHAKKCQKAPEAVADKAIRGYAQGKIGPTTTRSEPSAAYLAVRELRALADDWSVDQ